MNYDSDSDCEDYRRFIEKSQHQLAMTEKMFAKSTVDFDPEKCVCMISYVRRAMLAESYLSFLYQMLCAMYYSLKCYIKRKVCKVASFVSEAAQSFKENTLNTIYGFCSARLCTF